MTSPIHRARKVRTRLKRFLVERDEGASAIELALIAPIFGLIFAASLDLGVVLLTRFQLDAAVSNGTSYALINTGMVNAEKGDDLSAQIASLISGSGTAGTPEATVVVNNGAEARGDGAKIAVAGRSGNADKCYCPTGDAWSLNWGAGRKCGASCPDGAPAGKFVAITLRQAYRPLFAGYGIVEDGFISAAAIVRTE